MPTPRLSSAVLCCLLLAACSRGGAPDAPRAATAEIDPGAAAAKAEALDARLEARRAFAHCCVDEVIRDQHEELARASSLLVLVTTPACGPGCPTPRIATRAAREHAVQGLRVLLVRTADAPTAGPLEGVATVTLPRCAPVAAPHADDFFLVDGTGRATSGGERNAEALRSGVSPADGLDPEPALAALPR